MGLETATWLSQLVAANPLASDDWKQGDDHLRLIKSTLLATFPNASKAFRFPTAAVAQTSGFSVGFPAGMNVLYPVDATGGAVTVSLPDPSSGGTANEDGFCCWVMKIDTGDEAVTIDASSTQTINGALTYVLRTRGEGVFLFWSKDDACWYAFGANRSFFSDQQLILESAASVPLVLGRTTDNTDEQEAITFFVGEGTGDTAGIGVEGTGSDAVENLYVRVGDATVFDFFNDKVRSSVPLEVGSNMALNSAGFIDIAEIAEPDPPGDPNVARLYTLGGGALAYKRDDDLIRRLTPASRAEMEGAATDVAWAAPDNMHYHPLMPKAGGRGKSAGGIDFGKNVASVVNNSTGVYTVTLSVTFASTAAFWVVVTPQIPGDQLASVEILSTNSFRVNIKDTANGNDNGDFGFAVYGTLEA